MITRMHPAPISFASLACPRCHEILDDDKDGTSCDQCGGLLVQRVWAERLLPSLGRPVLPPVFASVPHELACPSCKRAMAPVLCHGVASFSCARCRWLFFDGVKRREIEPGSPPPPPALPVRAIARANLVAVFAARAHSATVKARDIVGLVVLTALVVTAVVLELRGAT
jgi:hypothetical protein